jgi:flagellar assembly protein FliH
MSDPGYRTPIPNPASVGDSVGGSTVGTPVAGRIDAKGAGAFAPLEYPDAGSSTSAHRTRQHSVSVDADASSRALADDEMAASQHLATVFPGFLSVAQPQSTSAQRAASHYPEWGAEAASREKASREKASQEADTGQIDAEEQSAGETGLSAEWQDGWLAGLQQGRQEGRQEGREEGMEEGKTLAASADREALHASLEQIRQQALVALNDFAAERERFLHELEQEAVRLALAIAARILRREAQMDPLLLTGAVRVALGQLGESTAVRLIVPETDRALWEESLRLTPGLRQRPQVIGDPRMELGECRIETGMGENGFGGADLSLHEQLREIERGFFDRLPQRQPQATQPSGTTQPSGATQPFGTPASDPISPNTSPDASSPGWPESTRRETQLRGALRYGSQPLGSQPPDSQPIDEVAGALR